jgi:hypothetical protein
MSRADTHLQQSTRKHSTLDPGPYEAVVLSHLDPKFGGGLQVELLKNTSTGNAPSRSGLTAEVRYLTPFYGVTSSQGVNQNDGYENSQKSYGMWAVPPDIGVHVLVIFAEGNPAQGFWIGCIPDTYMNFMLPGNASTQRTGNDTPDTLTGKKLPVAEYNKRTLNAGGVETRPTTFNKPYHKEFTRSLLKQGLLEDEIRGTTTSSARREVPSMVFGISTPGQVDRKGKTSSLGPKEGPADVPTNRLGGSSFVMDDGDPTLIRKGHPKNSPSEYANIERGEEVPQDRTLLQNELIRLRTRTGHQILMHDTEDLIYIGNARGTSWIELSSNGKIDIYAEDSISVHTAQDLNFTADRDINFTAGEDMNMVVGKQQRTDAGGSINTTSGQNIAFNASTSFSTHANTSQSHYAKESFTAIAQAGNATLLAGSNLTIGATGQIAIEADGRIAISTENELHTISKLATKMEVTTGNYNLLTGNGNQLFSATASGTTIEHNGTLASIPVKPTKPVPITPTAPVRAAVAARVPQHEPWYQHENLNPLNFTPEKTRAGEGQSQAYPPSTFDTFDTRTKVTVETSTTQEAASAPFDATTGVRDVAEGSPALNSGTTTTSTQPVPRNIPALGDKTQAYAEAVARRESNNSYDAVGADGRLGRYQISAVTLEANGYLKPGSFLASGEAAVNQAANWTGKDGVHDSTIYLADKVTQEQVFITFTEKNLSVLKSSGTIIAINPVSTVAGILFVAHKLGVSNAAAWRDGSAGRDSFGTTADEYFKLGAAI